MNALYSKFACLARERMEDDRLERPEAGRTGEMSSTRGSDVVELIMVEFFTCPFSLNIKSNEYAV